MPDRICDLPGCTAIVPPRRLAHSRYQHVFCSTQHRADYHNARVRTQRMAAWEAAPSRICEECHKPFKPVFQSGWHTRRRCPECRLPHVEAQRRYREKQQSERLTRAPRRLGGRDVVPRYKCQRCGKLIRNGNRLHCENCRAWYLRQEDAWIAECMVETIDLRHMGGVEVGGGMIAYLRSTAAWEDYDDEGTSSIYFVCSTAYDDPFPPLFIERQKPWFRCLPKRYKYWSVGSRSSSFKPMRIWGKR